MCGFRRGGMPTGNDHSPPAGRKVFSRLKSPFTSSSRNVTDFSVRTSDGGELFNSRYSPGDIVSGYVRLRVARPVRITHVVVCLHGFVQVYKTPGNPGEGFRANSAYLGTKRGKKSGEYFGNGFASLFEDEEVLCGDGRLAEGEYRFNFELEFPKTGLPSSIDFERGTVSYMITATLTRPHTMSPTISADRKVTLVEAIDIAALEPPESKTMTLHPLAKKSRTRTSAKKLATASEKQRNSTSESQDANSARERQPSSASSSQATGDSPEGSAQSVTSFVASDQRASQAGSQARGSPHSTPTPTISDGGTTSTSRLSLANKVVVINIESLAGGCLPNQSIPIKVNVSHTKPLKSVYGVILTLFRQARVDMHPSIPLGPIERGKERKYDYYPKSKTGLGGLSLSGAGSSHVFRKELSQTLASLFVNPDTLTAEVNAKVRVPEETFPTISGIPGAMISFKYYVEVVVDIQGKLQGLEKSVNNLTGQLPPTGHFLNAESSVMERSAFTPFGSTIIDTASVRRDKGVVTCTFEVIIGTKDSDAKGKKKMLEIVADSEGQRVRLRTNEQPFDPYQQVNAPQSWNGVHDSYPPQWYDGPPDSAPPTDHDLTMYNDTHYNQNELPPPHVPIPQMPDESQLSEKERIRVAETRLLPSQPPGLELENEDASAGATAPFLPGEGAEEMWQRSMPQLPEYVAASSSSTAWASSSRAGQELPSQPWTDSEMTQPIATSSTHAAWTDDNGAQATREQQIATQAQAPLEDGLEINEDASATMLEPSAPTLSDIEGLQHDEHDSHADAAGSRELPVYQR